MTPRTPGPARRRKDRDRGSLRARVPKDEGRQASRVAIEAGGRPARSVSTPAHAIVLKSGRERSVRRRHPWVFSGAIDSVRGEPAMGETVAVLSADGELLAHAAYSPHSQIRARIWSFDTSVPIDAAFMTQRLRQSLAYRRQILPATVDACRLVHAESDGLPGLIVDRYADTAVMHCSSAGAEYWRDVYAAALVELGACANVYERSDAEVRRLEGLAPREERVIGAAPPDTIRVREGTLTFLVDVRHGQKTGFYIDQRDNRARVHEAAQGRRVLDVFSYTGGFALAALAGGATSVTAIESSAEAIAVARDNAKASELDADAVRWIEDDAFVALRRLCAAGERFDLVVLDPPKFAPTERHVQRAARAYKDINLWAFRLLSAGGMLYTFSCSGGIDAQLLQSIVAGAAVDAGVEGRIVARLTASPDHPVSLDFPEGEYLKGLVVAV